VTRQGVDASQAVYDWIDKFRDISTTLPDKIPFWLAIWAQRPGSTLAFHLSTYGMLSVDDKDMIPRYAVEWRKQALLSLAQPYVRVVNFEKTTTILHDAQLTTQLHNLTKHLAIYLLDYSRDKPYDPGHASIKTIEKAREAIELLYYDRAEPCQPSC
jgi:hypothetical protein